MAIKAVLFDLDGTLLPMDQDLFIRLYFKSLSEKLAPYGYEPKQFIETMWTCIGDMVRNNGERTNEMAFWSRFTSIYGEKTEKDTKVFEEYYNTEFDLAKSACRVNPLAKKLIDMLKERGIAVALATNPVFPRIATHKRIGWAGLKPSDFALITTYESSSYCKPNLGYYKEILSTLGVSAEECLMVGNDTRDDMPAKALNMRVFLLTDCLINQSGEDVCKYPNGDFLTLISYIEKII